MSNTNTSPNMNIVVPVPGQDPGPDWANNIYNAFFFTVDGHNHTNGNGALIPSAGISINADLPFNNNNLTLSKSVQFQAQGGTLGNSVSRALYSVGLDLYYNNGNGVAVQVTSGGGVAGTPGSIANLVAPASASYVAMNSAFVFQSAVNTAAVIDGGKFIFRDLVANAHGITLQSPTGLAADYAITFPAALPASNGSALVMDTSGNITAVAGGANPPGTIIAYGGVSAPAGYVLCDGTSYLRAGAMGALFAAIGTAYGTADGTHFNVPDLRGQFLRGVTGASANDPDAASRTAMNAGGNTGNNVGSIQADQFKSHIHGAGSALNYGGGAVPGRNQDPFGIATSAAGGNETRPINAYVTFLIKI